MAPSGTYLTLFTVQLVFLFLFRLINHVNCIFIGFHGVPRGYWAYNHCLLRCITPGSADVWFQFLKFCSSGTRYIAANAILIELSPCWSCITSSLPLSFCFGDMKLFFCSFLLQGFCHHKNGFRKWKQTCHKSTLSTLGHHFIGRKSVKDL